LKLRLLCENVAATLAPPAPKPSAATEELAKQRAAGCSDRQIDCRQRRPERWTRAIVHGGPSREHLVRGKESALEELTATAHDAMRPAEQAKRRQALTAAIPEAPARIQAVEAALAR
jgi:hypothetical protein